MQWQYTYGPVPSRRLGRSLGVDLVPPKTCNLNCVYCQLGPTDAPTMERAEYAPVEEVAREVRRRLEEGPEPDYVTLGGSGEPTLHSGFGQIARRVAGFSPAPLALLTNGTLFHLPEVRADCDSVDLVLPSLDAGDEATFRLINRPHPSMTHEKLVSGLASLRMEFDGRIWLEVFIVDGLNSGEAEVRAIRDCIDRIKPDRVQVNTPVRPTAEERVGVPSEERLEQIRRMLGERAEIIAPGGGLEAVPGAEARRDEVMGMLRRRPCTLEDIAGGLGIHRHEAAKYVRALQDEGLIRRRQRGYDTYYEAAGE